MKFSLVSKALTSLIVTSTSAAHDFTPKGIRAAIRLETQGDDALVGHPCNDEFDAAVQCLALDAGDEATIYACSSCLGFYDATCDDVCSVFAECVATNCGVCADAANDLGNCVLEEEYVCGSCSFKDSVDAPEFTKG
jgi:hypothetical protein